MRCSLRVRNMDGEISYFRRTLWGRDLSIGYAFSDAAVPDGAPLQTAERTLSTLAEQKPLDHLHVLVAGGEPQGDDAKSSVVCDGRYLAYAVTHSTHEVLELAEGYDEFLMTLGRHLRRDVRRRRTNAEKAGLVFELSQDTGSIGREERYALGKLSRPLAFSRETIDEWDRFGWSQPGFFHCSLRDATGKLLSYCAAFAKGDSVVMLYQLNDKNFPDLALTMSLRGYLIERCIEWKIRRLVLPMGISGHLQHAASTLAVTEVLFVMRSFRSLAKALLVGCFRPSSQQAAVVRRRGFLRWALTGARTGELAAR